MKRFKRIYVEITNVCNLACSFCPKSKRAPKFMEPESFLEVLDQIKPYTDYIYFHVKGEPLLHPQIDKLLDISGEKGIRVNITTNGTLIDQVKEKLIGKPALRQINFSLHSVIDLNKEANCGIVRSEEYLEKIFSFIRQQKSCSNLISSLRLWNLERSEPSDGTVMNSGNRKLLEMIEKEFELDYQIDESTVPARGIKLDERVYLNRDYLFQWPDINLKEETHTGFCHGLRDQIAILADGNVVPCCLDGEGVIDLGNVFSTDFSEIIGSERAAGILKGFSQRKAVEELCRKCGYRSRFGQ